MWLRTAFIVALAAAGVWQGYNRWQLRPVRPSDGPIAPDDPLQADADGATPTALGRWHLTPRARYDITARILAREDYRFDRLSDLIPEDLALGWGPMSDNKVIRAFDISNRTIACTVPLASVENSSVNNVGPALVFTFWGSAFGRNPAGGTTVYCHSVAYATGNW